MFPLTSTAEASQRSAEQRSLHVHVALAPRTCTACMQAVKQGLLVPLQMRSDECGTSGARHEWHAQQIHYLLKSAKDNVGCHCGAFRSQLGSIENTCTGENPERTAINWYFLAFVEN